MGFVGVYGLGFEGGVRSPGNTYSGLGFIGSKVYGLGV